MKSLPTWKPEKPLRHWTEAKRKPQRIEQDEDGNIHQLPMDPYEWWLKPAGNVVALAMMTTRNIQEAEDPKRYHHWIKNDCLKKDWLPWEYEGMKEYCPDKLTIYGVKSKEEWNVKREEILKERQAQHWASGERYRNAFAQDSEIAAAKSEAAMSKALEKFTDKLTDMMADKGKK